MIEAEFEQAVVDLAHLFGWKVAAFRPARTDRGWRTPVKYDGTGWPDLALAHRDGRLLLAELKSTSGRTTPGQDGWADTLAAGGCYRLWRPSDADKIASELSGGRITRWHLTEITA